ncbi:MAG TPA: restriction endonuclease subunit S [Fimbriimonadaceae bacterium]|jgi:type I restriction enzyme S subunit
MKDSGITWLGQIPAHWNVVRLKYLFRVVGGGTPSKDKPEYWNGDIPWVSPKDMKQERVVDTEDHITEEAVLESTSTLIQPGAALVVCRSGILKHSIPVAINEVELALNQDMRAFIARGSMTANYLKWLIWANQDALLAEWSKSGATVESLELDLMLNSTLPVPPVSEALAITNWTEHITVGTNEVKRSIQEGITTLQARRSALIDEAVTGQLKYARES